MGIFQLPTSSRDDVVAEGTILAGKYRAEKTLGAGAMGVVVRVTRIETGETCALKFLKPSVARDKVAAKRFLREAAAARRIESPHVVKISDVGELDTGSPYLVMEYLEGSTLEKRLAGNQQLPVTLACDLAQQIAEGLAAAHAMGVIHRDIKPANLYLTAGADGDQVLKQVLKIVDFGVSKILDPEGPDEQHLTRTQTSIGSPLYMAPEQMRSARTADGRADQWSLGAVLYRMATGCLPFDAKSLPRLCVQVMEGEFEPMLNRRPDLPPELAAAVERCLRVDPAERYANVAELAEALAPYAGPEGRERAERCRQHLRRPRTGAVPVVVAPEPSKPTT